MSALRFNTKNARKHFKAMHDRHKKIKEAHKDFVKSIIAIAIANINKHFEDEKGPEGAWKRWSKAYTSHMKKVGKGSNKKLQDTGRLRAGVKAQNWQQTSRGIEIYNDAKTKSGEPYAYYHNVGENGMPRREFMWLDDEAMNKVSRITLAFMMGRKK